MAEPRHAVAIIGGATAGAEVAARLNEKGVAVVVFDQNTRPYGKIEDGLPRWHVGLRHKEYAAIDGKLGAAGVQFVPRTRLGKDVTIQQLRDEWGFSAVVLANGAWRDRPLPVDGADKYVGKGVIYQNPLIIWFNHLLDPAYTGPRFTIEDGAAVVGGGLASIDVMKLLMLGSVQAKLEARGIKVGHFEEYEQDGVTETLNKHGLKLADLGLRGATLYYRRRIEDMPLAEIPADATPEKRAKVEATRKKMVDKATEKYGFKVEPLSAPQSLIVEGDRVVGLKLARQKMEGGKPVPSGETIEHRGPYIVASIGSIPEPIPGIDMKGELFNFVDTETGRIHGMDNVFSTGNVVTGKGNIVASRRHATALSSLLVEKYLGLAPGGAEMPPSDAAARTAEAVAGHLGTRSPLPAEKVDAILQRVKQRQAQVGYADYASWLKANPPPPEDAAH